MRWFLSVIVFAVCFLSCKEKNHSHLPAAKMQVVLKDLHLAEAYSTLVPKDSLRPSEAKNTDSLAKYYHLILKHHGVSWDEFQKSLLWYQEHPRELDNVYIKLIADIDSIAKKPEIKTNKPIDKIVPLKH